MFSRSAYRRVLGYFPNYRGALIAGALCLLASRVLMVAAPRLLQEALRALEKGGADAIGSATRAGWLFFAISVLAGLFTFAMRRLLVGTSRRFEQDLKRDVFAHVERLPASFFDRTRTGDLISRLTSDVDAVRFSLGPGIMYVGSTLVLFPLALMSMLDISTPVTLIALAPLLAIIVVVRVLGPGIMRRTRAVQDRIGDLSARAQESFAGARVVRAYATEDVEEAAFRRENEALVRETIGLAWYRAFLTGGLYALGGGATLAVLWYGGTLVMEGRLSRADLVPFLAYVGMLIWPMISVGWVVSAFQRSAAAMERIDAVLTQAPEATAHPAEVLPDAFDGGVEVRNLTFTYPGSDTPALVAVDLDVPAGSTLGLVGPVGAGKSTLLSVLTRTYEPPPGTVLLDGVDVTTVPLERLRAAFAVVPQDAFLFSDTIANNLAYAVPGPLEPARARNAIATAGLETDIAAFPQGLETRVGERGLTLSGGQKQRTTLARALLREAPLLLLDDCLSAVDTETETRILDRLQVELRRHTSLVVAHRLSTVRHADRIVVLQAGRVAESGTHAELVAAGGWYARTYADQRLQAELEGLS